MRVTLFTKPDCHLCEVVKVELEDLQDQFGFALIEKNILEDEALLALYRIRVPVVEIASERDDVAPVQLEAPIHQVELRRQIQSAAAQA